MRDAALKTIKKACVLLVQPEHDDRDMYAEYLRIEGFVPIAASTASEALLLAADADAIVTAILLPGDINGIELVARLREDDRTKHLPIIVLTACALEPQRMYAHRAGCDTFLPKPCLPDRLVRELRLLLSVRTLHGVRGKPIKSPLRKAEGRRARGRT